MNIVSLGGAVEHWLGFQEKIGRSFMMKEDALKYPMADYLVNAGDIGVKEINLEYPLAFDPGRHLDLAIIDVQTKLMISAFEFKIAKLETAKQTEKQRVFDDIARLYFTRQNTSDKCYFLIAGKSFYFINRFKDYPNANNRFYGEWFEFGRRRQKVINIAGTTNPIYSGIYNAFTAEYGMTLPSQIKTRCEFITSFRLNYVPYMAGIWSID